MKFFHTGKQVLEPHFTTSCGDKARSKMENWTTNSFLFYRKTPTTPKRIIVYRGGSNSDTMALAALSHGLLTYTAYLQAMVFVLPPWSKPQGFPQV